MAAPPKENNVLGASEGLPNGEPPGVVDPAAAGAPKTEEAPNVDLAGPNGFGAGVAFDFAAANGFGGLIG